ncbi:MAG TPA: two-component regulator propeller domain-containing protein [Verrucomicrobiae bacterium]|nr:two-component regulator propeller domain-containing protein [Verrucomicrobiae bacterium]
MPRRNPFVLCPAWIILAAAWLLSGNDFSAWVSASPNYFVRSWQAEQGLPQNKVTAIVQDHDGYLWVGTYSGLARFDGVRFTTFDENNTPALRSSRITSLFETADGVLWIGDESGQITQYKDGQFKAVDFHPAWSGGKIYDITSDGSGDVWLLNESGQLARVSDRRVLTPEAGAVAKLVDMARSTEGKIWVAREGRVSVLDQGRLYALHLAWANSGAYPYVQGIGASRDGGLWVASDGRIRKWKGDQWVEDLGNAPWGVSPVTRLLETRNGVLAAGTADGGLFLMFPGQNEKPLHFDHASGFPSDWITSLYEDREGNLWVGTGGGGLVILRPNNIETVSPPDQWQGRAVLSVCPGQEGALWIGTEGAGLYRLQDGNWTNFASAQGIRNSYVWSLAEDTEGRLWAGTWGGGLFMQNGGHFEYAPGMTNVNMPMPALLNARDGGLWIGTAAGLLRYQAGRTNWFSESNGQPLRDVRTVAEDNQGAVWFGMAGGGLACLKNHLIGQFRTTEGLSSDFIECLHFDKEGVLWIGTFGGGLDRLKDGHFAVINRKQGLPNSVIGDIEEDDRGFFWMSSHDGIIRVSAAELNRCADGKTNEIHCQTYGINDGMPTIECSEGLQPAGCKTADGRLWFPTSKGLVSVNPLDVQTNPLPPPVQIEAVLMDDHPVPSESTNVPIVIAPGRHRFEFQYTGLSFVDPEKVQFKCRLNGFEADWVSVGTKRTVNYNYIPPGNYSFQVIACNNDGVWNETGASIPFTVLPFFWQTLWFRVLAWVAIVTASGGLVWFDTRRRMHRKLERLEWQRAVEHERARIAHDIHDDLGAHLTRISMLSESARAELDNPERAAAGLNQIYDTARDLTRAMDEIVWAVNPRHDTLEGLASYLEKFAQDLLAAADIRCRLDMPMELPPWRLTADVRHNLFLAFKEALHNVVKHSAASETYIRLAVGTASFELIVEDNGRGFVSGMQKACPTEGSARLSTGNGLENMQRRLLEISGHCHIESTPAHGTKVTFTVPLKIVAA